MIQIVNSILSILVTLAEIVSAVLLLSLFVSKKATKFFGKYALQLAFLVALTATLGSLFYSDIAGYEPCKLCWYQRIFMYPQTILIGLALWKKDKSITRYSIVLSVIGGIIALYHYLLQIGIVNSLPCSAVGYSASCSQRFVLTYGYVTIPMMALSGFLLILILMIIYRSRNNAKQK